MSIRPWQHVLEPLAAYLLLSERLYLDGIKFAQAWNFGPNQEDAQTVQSLINCLAHEWGGTARSIVIANDSLHEATNLRLDISKSRQLLGWQPKWLLPQALKMTAQWDHAFNAGANIRALCLDQIQQYQAHN